MQNKKRKIVAIVAGVVVAGTAAASAASLGGLNSDRLGANDTIVLPGDSNGVKLSYVTAYDTVTGKYQVTDVTLSDVDVPVGEKVDITLTNSTNQVVGRTSGTVSGTTQTFTLAAPAPAEVVTHAAVVISG